MVILLEYTSADQMPSFKMVDESHGDAMTTLLAFC